MNITSANGVSGVIIQSGGDTYFRVYHDGGAFTDYDLRHSDLVVTINDSDAFFYEDGQEVSKLDHSPATLGICHNDIS